MWKYWIMCSASGKYMTKLLLQWYEIIYHHYIVVCHNCCLFLVSKAALQQSDTISWTFQTALLVLILAFTLLLIISILLMTIYQKCHVNIFWKYHPKNTVALSISRYLIKKIQFVRSALGDISKYQDMYRNPSSPSPGRKYSQWNH